MAGCQHPLAEPAGSGDLGKTFRFCRDSLGYQFEILSFLSIQILLVSLSDLEIALFSVPRLSSSMMMHLFLTLIFVSIPPESLRLYRENLQNIDIKNHAKSEMFLILRFITNNHQFALSAASSDAIPCIKFYGLNRIRVQYRQICEYA
jgi:hypothetical protein